MPTPLVRRRRSAPIQPPVYRPCDPEARTRTLSKVSDIYSGVAQPSWAQAKSNPATERLAAAAHRGAGLRQAEHQETSPAEKADRIARAYDRLAVEQALFTSAYPGAWLQRSIDRADDGEAVIDLIKSYHLTQHDIARIEAELLRRPVSQQTANRWMLRLHHTDLDNSVRVMGETARAKDASDQNGTPYEQPMLGQVLVAGMRIAHESWRCATWVDMSYKGLSDDHLHALLSLVEGFDAMQFLDLSHNAITDAHMGFLAAMLHGRAPMQGLDLTGNPITERGIADFNTISLCHGSGLCLRDDLQAARHTADEEMRRDIRDQQSAVFEVTFGTPLRAACGMASTGAQAVQALAAEPGALRHMCHLDLSGKSWQLADIQGLANLLARDGMRLWHLDFTDSTLPEGGVAALAQALGHAHQLTTLRLARVAIDAAGDAHLHALVCGSTTLTHIAASNMPRTDAELLGRAGHAPGSKPTGIIAPPRQASFIASVESPYLGTPQLRSLQKQVTGALRDA